jgi:hypothetical protein
LKISQKSDVLKKSTIWIIKNSVLIFIFVFLFFMLNNSFPQGSYESVSSKWSKYGKVVPPKDYELSQIRPIDYDFLAPKESVDGNDFYWLQITGDLLTLTNRNFGPIRGAINLNLDPDPCGNSRKIIFGTQNGPLEFTVNKGASTPVRIDFEIKSNSSIFLAINTDDKRLCKINEGLKRNFMVKITNVTVDDIEINR